MALNVKNLNNKPNKADLLIDSEKSKTKNFSNDVLEGIKSELDSIVSEPRTKKHYEDIDINLIDEYSENKRLFGYKNYDSLKNSIGMTGTDDVDIKVVSLDNGRYLCYSGNTRLKILKNAGEKTATCKVFGPHPGEDELRLMVLLNNTQRDMDAYHTAINIKEYENAFRKKFGLAGDKLTDAVGKQVNLGKTMIFEYKKILALPEEMQPIFELSDIPVRKALKVLSKVPSDKVSEFMSIYNELDSSNVTFDNIESIVNNICPSSKSDKPKTKVQKIGTIFKNLSSVTRNDDGTYYVKPKKKAETLEEIHRLEEQLELIKAACK